MVELWWVGILWSIGFLYVCWRWQSLAQQHRILEIDYAKLQVSHEDQLRWAEQQLKDLSRDQTQWQQTFLQVSEEVLEKRGQNWQQQQEQSLQTVLLPFQLQLKGLQERLNTWQQQDERFRSGLIQELGYLRALNQQMSEEATQLTQALKGNVKIQGNWGEWILEKVLENAGLQLGREYDKQVSQRDENQQRAIPDVILRLPNGQDLVIDAKVSLNAYIRYCDSTSSEAQQSALQQHVVSLQQHVQSLAKKAYQRLPDLNSVDFILMFMPVEAALSLALSKAPDLMAMASQSQVIFVTPTTLWAVVQLVAQSWRAEAQNKNVQAIAQATGDLYDKFLGFIEPLESLQQKLDQAQEALQHTQQRLYQGRGNILSRVEAIRAMGIKHRKQLPEKMKRKLEAVDLSETLEEPSTSTEP